MLTALFSPTEMGFAHLINNEDLESSDGVYKKISDPVKCIVDVWEGLGFRDADHTQPIVDVFSDQWKTLFSKLDDVGAFDVEHVLSDEFRFLMTRIALAFAKHIVKVFDEILVQHPWLDSVTRGKKAKLMWPTDFAEIADGTDAKMDFAIGFLQSKAVEVLGAAEIARYNEGQHCLTCIAVGRLRRDVTDASKTKSRDATGMRKRADALDKYFEELADATDNTASVPTRYLHKALVSEREGAEQLGEDIYTVIVNRVAELAEKCKNKKLSESSSLDLEPLYAKGKIGRGGDQ